MIGIILHRIVSVLNIPRESHKLQGTLPPESPPITKPKGPFCIKAQCNLENDATFTGYNTDYSIAQDTLDFCNSFSSSSNKQCSDPQISIIPINNIKNCEKHIICHNLLTNTETLMFP